ncbi:MAG: XF1762 family protein [Beduini sp.]|uniref:XF1762 family protein n=1 Tax=Beduini sp. TaxID=1922300 RepID=UPI0039A0F26D
MRAVPIELKEANNFVAELHRHHPPVYRDKFRLACIAEDGHICGVIQVARPVARHLDDGKTLEVVRCCTDGTYNACSFLYSRMTRIAKEMGYKKIITYILDSETGASLKAAGWHKEADIKGHSWNCKSRPRCTKAPTCNKQRWCRYLNAED